MRAPTKQWLMALPITTLLPIVLAIWQGLSGEVGPAIGLGVIAALCAALTVQNVYKAHPERHPIALLHAGLKKKAKSHNYEVLQQIGSSTYVFVEDDDTDRTITLWFFDGNLLEVMNQAATNRIYAPAVGMRVELETQKVLHHFGLAVLHQDPKTKAFSIEPPKPERGQWESRQDESDTRTQKRLLVQLRDALTLADHRGKRHRFDQPQPPS